MTHNQIDYFGIISETSTDAILMMNKKGSITFWNQAAEQIMGYRKEEIIGKNIQEIILPQHNEDSNNSRLRDFLNSGTERVLNTTVEVVARHRDENSIHLELSVSGIRNDENWQLMCILRDITHRKQAEDQLKESEEKYRGLYESMRNLVVFTDMEGTFQECNGRCIDLLGYTKDEMKRVTYQELTPARWHTFEENILRTQIIPLGYSEEYEKEYIRKDGSIFPISVRAWLIRDDNGVATGLWAIITDITERKEKESALRESEARFKRMADSAPVLIWTSGTDTLCDFFNKSWLTFTGRTLEQELGNGWSEGVHPEDFKRCLEIYLKSFRDRKEFRMEYRLMHADGRYHWLLDNGVPRFTEEGAFMGYIGSCVDITELKTVEETMRNLTKAVEQSPVSILITNLEGDIEYANPKTCEITGFDRTELLGKNIRLMKSGETPVDDYRSLWKSITKGKSWKGTLRNRKKSGELYWEDCEIAPITDSDGQTRNYLAIKQDISERIKTEAQIANLAFRYQTILSVTNDGIHILDMEGRLVEANDAFYFMLGHSREESTLLKVSDWDAKWEGEELMEKVREATQASSVFETSHRRKDGSVIDVEIKTSKVVLEGQDFQCASSRDITARKQIESEIKAKNEELQQINAEKDKFFSILAHDLRSPFNGLMGLTDLMTDETLDLSLDEMKRFSAELNKSAHHTYNLLESLLDWSQMKRGLVVCNPRPLSLSKVIRESVLVLEEPAHQKSIELELNLDAATFIVADLHMFQTIIRNLTSNAIKFTVSGGNVEISALRIDNLIQITVKDTGIGMSETMRNNLFRLDVNTKRPGTAGELSAGLGLLLCRDFVEKMGGEIVVESVVNEGSTFRFTVPVFIEKNPI